MIKLSQYDNFMVTESAKEKITNKAVAKTIKHQNKHIVVMFLKKITAIAINLTSKYDGCLACYEGI